MTRPLFALGLALALMLPGFVSPQAASLDTEPWRDPLAFLEQAMAATCSLEDRDAEALGTALGGARLLDERPLGPSQAPLGWRRRFGLRSGDEVLLVRQGPADLLHRFFLEVHQDVGAEDPAPLAMAIAGSDCRIFHGRRMHRDDTGQILEIEILGPGLLPSGETEPLNPPVPEGRDPGGVAVALFDSGLNYTLPDFARRLGRDSQGRLLGYDFWDQDGRPFDSHPPSSPFLPQRHGTTVASVLLAEAPQVRFLPYRYPRPDMSRMAQMVEAASAAGAVIVAMPMGSNREDDWRAFAQAAQAHAEMLFIVSAGNNGRDIDAVPLYPAVLPLENLLVVTSAARDGRPAPGSNWGRTSVDLLVPAENLPVLDFSGLPSEGSGSSFAVTRLAAMAVRLKEAQPEWRGPELKQAILDLAVPGSVPPTTRHGWIPDPTALP